MSTRIHLLGEEYVATKHAKFTSYEEWLKDNPSVVPTLKHPKQFLRPSQEQKLHRQYEFFLRKHFMYYLWDVKTANAAANYERQKLRPKRC